MAKYQGTTVDYEVNVAASGAPGKVSFAITKNDDTDVPEHRYVHVGGTAGTVLGFLVGDDPAGSVRTFYLHLGDNMLRFRRIKTGGTALGILGIR